jgi:hypothetical protein
MIEGPVKPKVVFKINRTLLYHLSFFFTDKILLKTCFLIKGPGLPLVKLTVKK